MCSVVVVLADGFEEIEALTPVDMLRRAGCKVTVAGLGKKVILSAHRVTFVCDAVFENVAGRDWDALILPGGGEGSKNLAASFEVMELAIRQVNRGALLCAICAAPAVVLGKSGLLAGKKVCCYPGCESFAPQVDFIEDDVVVDGRLITARGPGCAMEFSMAIVRELLGGPVELKLRDEIILR